MVNSLIALFMTAAVAAPNTITLSQKDVAELVLKQGYATKEITASYEQLYLQVAQARAGVGSGATVATAASSSTTATGAAATGTTGGAGGAGGSGGNTIGGPLDWSLTLEGGYLHDKSESLTRPVNDTTTKYRQTSAVLSKSLLTGTALAFSFNRNSMKNDSLDPNAETQLTADTFGISLEQSLLGNSFGYGTRAKINRAELSYESAMTLRTNELEDAVLAGIRQFWNTYVAQENFRESIASRDRYGKLVSAVRRKNSLGYSAPGEFSQVQAEYENRVQEVKSASAAYLENLDRFLTMLSLPPGTEINFNVPTDPPPVPKLTGVEIEGLRTVRAQDLRRRSAEAGVTSAKSDQKPTLNLVGRYTTSGVDESSERSYSELTAASKPQYYVGLRFGYTFGNNLRDETVRAARAALLLEETRLARTRAESRDELENAERKVGSTYAIAASAREERNYREKAVQELTRTYNQGRTEIRTLIDAMNNLFATEVKAVRALGDYQIALNEWAASRDELIPEQKKEENQ